MFHGNYKWVSTGFFDKSKQMFSYFSSELFTRWVMIVDQFINSWVFIESNTMCRVRQTFFRLFPTSFFLEMNTICFSVSHYHWHWGLHPSFLVSHHPKHRGIYQSHTIESMRKSKKKCVFFHWGCFVKKCTLVLGEPRKSNLCVFVWVLGWLVLLCSAYLIYWWYYWYNMSACIKSGSVKCFLISIR